MLPPPAGGRRRLHEPDQLSRSAEEVLAAVPWRSITWRRGTKGRLTARFAVLRIRAADGGGQQIGGRPAQHLPGEEAWVVGEWRASGETRVPPVQPARRHRSQGPGRHHQGALDLRAGAPADERGTRPRPLRGALLGGAAPTHDDDDDRSRVPAAPSPSRGRAGEKGGPDHPRSPVCPPCGPLASLTCSAPEHHRDARTAESRSTRFLRQNCQSSVSLSVGAAHADLALCTGQHPVPYLIQHGSLAATRTLCGPAAAGLHS